MTGSPFDQHPLIVALAGSNGAGKSIFYHAHLRPGGLRFVNADVIALELDLDPNAAARLASIYTPRGHEWDHWRAACVSLPVQERDTGGLTPLRSPDSFSVARSRSPCHWPSRYPGH